MEERQMNVKKIEKIFILLLILIGFLTTVELAVIYYNSIFNKYAMPSFCSINSFIDCDGVAKTTHSQFLGVPLAYWGMFLYLFMGFMLIVDKLKKVKFLGFLEVFKNPMTYIAALGFIAFGVSMILAGISLFEIKKICILCVFTYFLDLAIAIVATDFCHGFVDCFKVSIQDFIDALKIKKYLVSFIIVAGIAGAGLYYTNTSNIFTPQVKFYNTLAKYIEMDKNPYAVVGNVLGDENAKTIVYIYTDYRCPMCRAYNIVTHKAVKEFGGFKIVHKNLPLDMECNKHLTSSFHIGSCMLARYAIAAEKQGHFWDMNSAIFDKQPQNEDAVLKMAESMGLNTAKLKEDADSTATSQRISDEIDQATALKINGTPTIVINGKVYIGLKPYDELKKILITNGAFKRK